MRQADELAALLGRLVTLDGVHQTAIPRLALIRSSQPTEPMHGLHLPALCIIVQGRKQVMLGEQIYLYDRTHYLVVSVDLPIIGQVVEASTEEPYFSVRLDLDPVQLSALMLESKPNATKPNATKPGEGGHTGAGPGLAVNPAAPELLDAMLRLVRLLETPHDIAVLAPLAEREILYRLMNGEQAARLRQIATAESKLQQVNKAIGWIRRNYDKTFSIEVLASEASMSPSALHQHFKAVTAMSPLQYQKQLRLQEARRLILGAALDAASAGFRVGYESPSQFSREYRRLFGAPPLRDVARLRGASALEMVGA
ncbi:AraC family transcriptional regulator [Bosea vaviloviae]|uniref:AraC family transcriptional regulator n=1 Tax=Bosea vaviloviae TaxID=1526658 RepID=A0A1D7TXM7_9HYPH|nr:AraC family transcriptional regulator [Bosea vaviloviae]AOO79878.1 AraC family transcriptional regulator [Bosea vaviloviae]